MYIPDCRNPQNPRAKKHPQKFHIGNFSMKSKSKNKNKNKNETGKKERARKP